MAVGGDLVEVTWNHPTLGSGRFLFKSGVNCQMQLGGNQSEDADDGIDTGGNMIDTMSIKRWSVEVDALAWDSIRSNRMELEAAQALSSDIVPADFTFTIINQVVYAGNGKIVGDIKGSAKDSIMPLKFAGGGILQKIS